MLLSDGEMASSDRKVSADALPCFASRLQTRSTGQVQLQLGVVLKDFNKFNITS